MRKTRWVVLTALGLAVLGAPAEAQVGEPVRERAAAERGMRAGSGPFVRNPATAVLEHRAELELTAEQVRRLEAIQARVEQENAPRIERLRTAWRDRVVPDRSPRSMTPEERQQLRERMRERTDAVAPIRDEIRETNRAAGAEIHGLLTAEQQTELRSIRRAHRDELRAKMRDRRDAMREGRRGPDRLRGERRMRRGT